MSPTYQHCDAGAALDEHHAPVGIDYAGQLRVRARITRTGCLPYADRAGNVHNEFRPASEVFDEKSIRSLEGVPVILHADHHGFVSPADWRRKSVGHVADVRRDGEWLTGLLVIADSAAIELVRSGELCEVSAGYLAAHGPGGVFDGTAYRTSHQTIRYNHVALLRQGAARAGANARIYAVAEQQLDARGQIRCDAVLESVSPAVAHRLRMQVAAFRADARAPRRAGTVSGVDAKSRSVNVIASTSAPVNGERLTSWDLTRYERNPIVLWGHDASALPIGRADQIAQGPDGLTMRVTFASADANPIAERVWRLVQEGIVRGVSVGFTPGIGRQLTDGTIERSANELLEVSFVTVPADEDALAEPADDGGERSHGRTRRLEDDENKNVLRFRKDATMTSNRQSDDFQRGYEDSRRSAERQAGHQDGRSGGQQGDEHPVAKARREHLERMRAISGGR